MRVGIEWHKRREIEGTNRYREANISGPKYPQQYIFLLSPFSLAKPYSFFEYKDDASHYFSRFHFPEIIKILLKYHGTTFNEFVSYLAPLGVKDVSESLKKIGAYEKAEMDARGIKSFSGKLPIRREDHLTVYEKVLTELKDDAIAKQVIMKLEDESSINPLLQNIKETIKFPLREYCTPWGVKPASKEVHVTFHSPRNQVIEVRIDRTDLTPSEFAIGGRKLDLEVWENELRKEAFGIQSKSRLWTSLQEDPRYKSIFNNIIFAHQDLLVKA